METMNSCRGKSVLSPEHVSHVKHCALGKLRTLFRTKAGEGVAFPGPSYLMLEVTHAREHHRDIMRVRSIDHILIAH